MTVTANQKREGRVDPPSKDVLTLAMVCGPSGPLQAKANERAGRPPARSTVAAYMSPEQVRGEKLDVRSDLFSFGLVLYEMATGRQAFDGSTVAEVHDAILHAKPIDVHELSPKIPAKLEAIIHKALETDREQRYANASELRQDLESLRKMERPHAHVFRWALRIAAAVIVLVVSAFVLRETRRPPSLPEIKLQQLTTNLGENPVRTGAIFLRALGPHEGPEAFGPCPEARVSRPSWRRDTRPRRTALAGTRPSL